MPSIGLLTLHLHINHASSLKQKRQVVRAVKDRLRNRLNVSVAEIDFHDRWQRSVIGVVSISADRTRAEQVLGRAEQEAARLLGDDLTSSETEFF